jgi:RNA-directed DNA polymerase
MDVQRWVLHNILSACRIDPASFAYQRERSALACAEEHIGARWLVKLDIHHFFDSIVERRIYPVFENLGYPPLLSLELTRLCTRADLAKVRRQASLGFRGKAPYAVGTEGYLPQGAPTSGALANAIMAGLDAKLSALASAYTAVYTRYSDDLVFSAASDFSRRRAVRLMHQAAAILGRSSFAVHRAKSRIIPPGARRVVLGLLVTDDRVHLLPEYKRRLEIHVRGAAKFGLVEHASHRRFASVLSMINHIDGCIAFAASVDQEFAHQVREVWTRALIAGGYES